MSYPGRGDFGLAKGGGWPMAVVRWGTGARRWSWGRFWRLPAKYGHAAVCVGPGPGPEGAQVVIVEATPAGVIKRNVDVTHFDWSTGGALAGQLTEEVRDEICRNALSFLGRRYDWGSILGFVGRWAVATYVRSERTGQPADRSLICSELVVRAYRHAGVEFPGLETRPAGTVAPSDLAPFLP